ncbi:MAG: nucleotide-binding domain-containing protein [Halarcobacter sp.]
MFKGDSEHKPISVIITTLAAKAYKGTKDLKETLDDIVFGMEREIDCNEKCIVLNPINPNENFADKWENEPIKKEVFFRWLEQLKIDYKYLSSDNYGNTKNLLENSFGTNAIQKTYNDSFGVVKNLAIRAKELLSLSHVQKPKWENNIKYRVDIICMKSKNGWMSKDLKSGEPIEKNWNLRFEAKIQNIGSGRKFYWQVANSGLEAKDANCLRGSFYEGVISKGGKVREESTSYSGSHFVRCFVIQDNKCVAISEPFIVNII